MPGCGHGRIYGAETASVQLNEVEVEALANFAKAHATCPKNGGWPQRFSVKSTATGIGPSIEVTCASCSKTENISDIGSW